MVRSAGATGKTWVRRPEARRTELLDAAEALFAERGVHATTVADITEAAAVSKGSFYVYFQSKDELLAALNDRFSEELLGLLDDVLATLAHDVVRVADDGTRSVDPAGLRAALEMSVERTVHALLRRRGLIAVWSHEPASIAASVGNLATVMERLAPFVAEGVPGERVVTCADPATTSVLVVHAIAGAVIQTIVLDQKVDEARLVASAQELAVRAYGLD